MGSDSPRSFQLLDRLGPWMLALVGLGLIAFALLTSQQVGFRLAALVLGVGALVGGLVLHRASRVALGPRDGFSADLQNVLDRNAAPGFAAAVKEAATRTIPDGTPDKLRIVQDTVIETMHTLSIAASLSGTWWAVLEAHKDRPRKVDLVEATVSGEDVTATIRRVSPDEQSGRRWDFVGKVRGGYLFGMFYTTTPDLAALSYGTIQLRRASDAGTEWTGFYVRLQVVSGNPGRPNELEPIKMCWQRDRPTTDGEPRYEVRGA